MNRKPIDRIARESYFTWKPGDIVITFPSASARRKAYKKCPNDVKMASVNVRVQSEAPELTDITPTDCRGIENGY